MCGGPATLDPVDPRALPAVASGASPLGLKQLRAGSPRLVRSPCLASRPAAQRPQSATLGMIPTHVLGISAFYHDSAACLLRDGEILAAAQEERFTRKKGDASFPAHAVRYCLQSAGISAADLAYVGFYDKPLLKFERILETYLGVAPRGFRSF